MTSCQTSLDLINLGQTSPSERNSIVQKTILVTGSTDGIGLETARMLVSLGHHVLLHGRNPAKLEETERALSTLSHHRINSLPITVLIYGVRQSPVCSFRIEKPGFRVITLIHPCDVCLRR